MGQSYSAEECYYIEKNSIKTFYCLYDDQEVEVCDLENNPFLLLAFLLGNINIDRKVINPSNVRPLSKELYTVKKIKQLKYESEDISQKIDKIRTDMKNFEQECCQKYNVKNINFEKLTSHSEFNPTNYYYKIVNKTKHFYKFYSDKSVDIPKQYQSYITPLTKIEINISLNYYFDLSVEENKLNINKHLFTKYYKIINNNDIEDILRLEKERIEKIFQKYRSGENYSSNQNKEEDIQYLKNMNIMNKNDWKQWLLKNHSDKNSDTDEKKLRRVIECKYVFDD